MLENACAKKRRLNPARDQRRNFGKLMRRDGCTDQRRMSSMVVAAGSNHGHRAAVLDAIRILVHALVELRRSTQRERPEKSRGNEHSDTSTRGRTAFHCPRVSDGVPESARLFF